MPQRCRISDQPRGDRRKRSPLALALRAHVETALYHLQLSVGAGCDKKRQGKRLQTHQRPGSLEPDHGALSPVVPSQCPTRQRSSHALAHRPSRQRSLPRPTCPTRPTRRTRPVFTP